MAIRYFSPDRADDGSDGERGLSYGHSGYDIQGTMKQSLTITSRVLAVVQEHAGAAHSADERFADIFDSLELLQLLNVIEEEFCIDVTPDQARRLTTIQDLVDLIEASR